MAFLDKFVSSLIDANINVKFVSMMSYSFLVARIDKKSLSNVGWKLKPRHPMGFKRPALENYSSGGLLL